MATRTIARSALLGINTPHRGRYIAIDSAAADMTCLNAPRSNPQYEPSLSSPPSHAIKHLRRHLHPVRSVRTQATPATHHCDHHCDLFATPVMHSPCIPLLLQFRRLLGGHARGSMPCQPGCLSGSRRDCVPRRRTVRPSGAPLKVKHRERLQRT